MFRATIASPISKLREVQFYKPCCSNTPADVFSVLLHEINTIKVTDYSVKYDIAAKASNAISVICTSMENDFKTAFYDLGIMLNDTPLDVAYPTAKDRSNIVLLDQPQVHVFFGLLVIAIFHNENYKSSYYYDSYMKCWISALCAKTGTILQSVEGNRLIMTFGKASMIREVLGGNMPIKKSLIGNTLDIAMRNDNRPITAVCKYVKEVLGWKDMALKG